MTSAASGDLIPIVDISDLTMSVNGTTKRVTQSVLSSSILASAQPLDATLTALAAVTTAADKVIYATGVDTFATTDLTSVSRTLLAQTTQALMRTTGLGLGTIATQAASSVAITGGTINGTVGATTPATGAFTSLSATGITTVASGTELLPSIISTTGTVDTGLWFPAADTLAASTAGVERIRIGSTGFVGIGTTNPGAQLDVKEATNGGTIKVSNVSYSGTFSAGNSFSPTLTGSAFLNLASGSGINLKIGNGTANWFLDDVAGLYTSSGVAALYASTGGSIGFLTHGSSTTYNAIQPLVTSNVSMGLKLNYITGGVTTEGVRLTNAGNVGINITSPNTNAILDVTSTTKAFMPPRMTTTQKNAIASPTAGMVVYDSTLNKLCVRAASAWETVTSV